MHLKTLTLRGFKSFASATTLRLEPGITCVVGPNGSGKSNVVDALSWVMGEQGAKSLRGGKMEDVIFAGTSGRPPLGRAEVALTIDNTDGALPIDYTEVTISRTMFRSGGSEYAINGSPCRLLDIQELLSDSGIGREMHVIVGQGQLDAVLHATPEERRAFIEEAAGVLKHRKRKEKAIRKLDAMQGNLQRLADLTTEIRRQLKPLGRQAEVARKAQVVQADLRDAKARLLADDLVTLTGQIAAELADEAAVLERRSAVEQELTDTRARLSALELATSAAAPQLSHAQNVWFQLSSLRERTRGTNSLAADRLRLLSESAPDERQTGRDPEDLEAQAALVREQEEELQAEVEGANELMLMAEDRRREAERAARTEEQRLAEEARRAADQREQLARLAGKVGAQRSTVNASAEAVERLSGTITDAEQRVSEAAAAVAALDSQVPDDGGAAQAQAEQAEALQVEAEQVAERIAADEAALEAAQADLTALNRELEALRHTEREAHGERKEWAARRDTLALGLRRKDGAGAVLAAGDRVPGLIGSLAAVLAVETGFETSVAAALGPAAEAVAVHDLTGALAALDYLAAEDGGQAVLVPAGNAGRTGTVADADPAGWPTLPPGARWARALVREPIELTAAIDRLLHRVAVVTDLRAAADLIRLWPELRVVTTSGELVSASLVRGGSASAPSPIETQAAVEQAEERVSAAAEKAENAGSALSEARDRQTEVQQRVRDLQGSVKQAQGDLRRVEGRLSELEGRRAQAEAKLAAERGRLAGTARAAEAEVERLRGQRERAVQSAESAREALFELEAQLEAASEAAAAADEEPDTSERDRLVEAASRLRSEETDARLALRTAEERARAVAGRSEQLMRRAAEERAARARAVAREERRQRQMQIARAVLAGGEYLLVLLEKSLATAAQERLRLEAERDARNAELQVVREGEQRLAAEQSRLIDSAHRDEVVRTEQRLRIDALRQRSVDELGMDPDVLIEEYGPHQLVPPSPPAPGDPEPETPPEPVPYHRATQEKRLRRAERGLNLLGTVNPLALEEFAALEERHTFLNKQLDDLKVSRRDLLQIIEDVDRRVEEVFTEAFNDTAREFVGVFQRLFPGGEGKLILTDPSNMLTTGLDVEARPPGKKVKRLSLLSGGERSLTAVALLVSIFKARPSPFYVMDEVEAALDDTNLGRLIGIFQELRESSQLIVITHQKRTMEVADALYGVTMRGDGVTTVISQRLSDDGDSDSGSGRRRPPASASAGVGEVVGDAGEAGVHTESGGTADRVIDLDAVPVDPASGNG
ncbi:chromosome partition protein Smc [Kineosporia sp. NBRC 101677]|uniref:chromosome segregation protein SMC n=1 Tax=Kineosporia sp. NBRC 101677 TaxID=3032197 RepID=UPI0024A53C03|nr:chromosome segregation protein SMC [Kineosporia sp. NBRC 101677]GLY16161.1 chromosome partition protein Smc [Kineosporia sp. NBRC 101677]